MIEIQQQKPNISLDGKMVGVVACKLGMWGSFLIQSLQTRYAS